MRLLQSTGLQAMQQHRSWQPHSMKQQHSAARWGGLLFTDKAAGLCANRAGLDRLEVVCDQRSARLILC